MSIEVLGGLAGPARPIVSGRPGAGGDAGTSRKMLEGLVFGILRAEICLPCAQRGPSWPF